MQLPDGYAARPPAPDDLDAAAAVLIADQAVDGIEPTLDAHFLRQVWSRPGFDLAHDAWVVTDSGGRIVAYGQVHRSEPGVVGSWGVVDPGHRGRGIGPALFDAIEARAAALLAGADAPRFRHSINARDAAAAAIAAARGLRPIRRNWHMQVDLDGPIDPAPDPAGIAVGGVGADDLRAVYGILAGAFADDPIDRLASYDEWVAEDAPGPDPDLSLWLLARDAGEPVGTLVASAGDGEGWVDWLAVRASHRGRGIGHALLRRSFAMLREGGLRRALVNVDAENVTGATAVYERAGMHVANAWDLWERSSG